MTRPTRRKLPPCICDDPSAPAWKRYQCRKKGCAKQPLKRGAKEDTSTTPEQKRKDRNARYRQNLNLEEAKTADTVKPRGSPGRPRKYADKTPTK